MTDNGDLIPESEVAHEQARERKRTTKMVVDNAGVKKILAARRERLRRTVKPSGDNPPKS